MLRLSSSAPGIKATPARSPLPARVPRPCAAARRACAAMFAAINAAAGESDTRDAPGETTEAQCARVTATYERALHALHGGRAAEAQGASRVAGCGCVLSFARQP